ncbi:SET and MYND domain-containing protein 4-like [Mizuhopecten yessoensis]|uniref:Protein-lysine N-methyltransferase SMYD4 n=1 Tax=Mizuhopecten yessoensis TaxID=6573 RepID=A0A210QZH8_MIZYE|nr:SET and MYND domain-containing protein 4-like [Mizuhopecten yessoensis]OWF54168.1 SET and MYND domain-containing protein 4 [Mizuhopecten yessoensis]
MRMASTTMSKNNADEWYDKITSFLRDEGTLEELRKKFDKCTSNEERVNLIYKLPIAQDVMQTNPNFKEKCEEVAVNLRNQGNAFFQKKKYKQALDLYTQSVLFSPCPSSSSPSENNDNLEKPPTLALAFANRSAVLYHMTKDELCLADIELALENGYPENLQYKLYDRRGKCYMQLKWGEAATEAFTKAKGQIRVSDLDEDKMKKIAEEIDKLIVACGKIKDDQHKKVMKTQAECNRSHDDLPVISSRNVKFPNASAAVTMEESEEMGRGIYAAEDIEIGDVLVVEKAYMSVSMPGCSILNCHNCCERLFSPFPCRNCAEVGYCSRQCEMESWKNYHCVECEHLGGIQAAQLGLGHLSFRMVLKAGFEYLKAYKDTADAVGDSFGSGFNRDGVYDSNDYNTVYNLVNHCEKRTTTDLLKRTINAVFLVKCLENSSFVPSTEKRHEDLMYVGGHILRHIQMLPCNAHEVSELKLKKTMIAESVGEEIGSAIYAMLSLFNHSCDPDVVRHSYGDVCVVRAIKKISKGREILDNYGTVYAVSAKSDRQKKLSQYQFVCNCLPCQNVWPLYFNIPNEVPIFKCEKCSSALSPVNNTTKTAKCTACKYTQKLAKTILTLECSDKVFRTVLEKFLSGNQGPEHTLHVLNKHLQFLQQNICLPWQDFNNCQEAIKQCYAMQANCHVIE